MRRTQHARRGAAAVEMALVGPLAMLMVLGMVVFGLGIFRYQQVAYTAREASRWASVHGSDYATLTGNPAATAADVYSQVILPKATGLNVNNLSYSVIWNSDNSPSHTLTVGSNNVEISNTVAVTVTYKWVPEAYFGGVTLTSTSVNVMSF